MINFIFCIINRFYHLSHSACILREIKAVNDRLFLFCYQEIKFSYPLFPVSENFSGFINTYLNLELLNSTSVFFLADARKTMIGTCSVKPYKFKALQKLTYE